MSSSVMIPPTMFFQNVESCCYKPCPRYPYADVKNYSTFAGKIFGSWSEATLVQLPGLRDAHARHVNPWSLANPFSNVSRPCNHIVLLLINIITDFSILHSLTLIIPSMNTCFFLTLIVCLSLLHSIFEIVLGGIYCTLIITIDPVKQNSSQSIWSHPYFVELP